jgi:hypothetical protein
MGALTGKVAKCFADIFMGASDSASNTPICPSDRPDWTAV